MIAVKSMWPSTMKVKDIRPEITIHGEVGNARSRQGSLGPRTLFRIRVVKPECRREFIAALTAVLNDGFGQLLYTKEHFRQTGYCIIRRQLSSVEEGIERLPGDMMTLSSFLDAFLETTPEVATN